MSRIEKQGIKQDDYTPQDRREGKDVVQGQAVSQVPDQRDED